VGHLSGQVDLLGGLHGRVAGPVAIGVVALALTEAVSRTILPSGGYYPRLCCSCWRRLCGESPPTSVRSYRQHRLNVAHEGNGFGLLYTTEFRGDSAEV
jgi:hypothetical protein